MIIYDSSEARATSRFTSQPGWQEVIGLETMTGADILISPLETPIVPVSLRKDLIPHRLAIKAHCQAGWLVQRKSGKDLANSVRKLTETFARMAEWEPQAVVLLATRDQTPKLDGTVISGGLETGMSWNALLGALMAWQLDGGLFMHLSQDEDIPGWLEFAEDRLKLWHKAGGRDPHVRIPRGPVRQIYPGGEPGLNVLASLPGIGEKKAARCLETWGTASVALYWLTRPDLYREDPALYPDGIGLTTVERIAQVMGGKIQED